MRPTFLFVLPFLLAASPLSLSAAPQWIWLSKDGNKDNKVTFRHRFEVPVNAHHATLELTCDNGADALLNGKPKESTLKLTLKSVTGISSDYEKARVLLQVAALGKDDEEVRKAIVEAARNISSEYERGRVLSATFK